MITTSVNSRCVRLCDGLTAIRGSVISSLIVIIVDMFFYGSYIFAALVCPLWFLVAVVRAVARRPSSRVAAARILMPLVTGLLVVANSSMQNKIAIRNAGQV